jgi:hypothetical protein
MTYVPQKQRVSYHQVSGRTYAFWLQNIETTVFAVLFESSTQYRTGQVHCIQFRLVAWRQNLATVEFIDAGVGNLHVLYSIIMSNYRLVII